jgi:hypothetical protein
MSGFLTTYTEYIRFGIEEVLKGNGGEIGVNE